uniref:Putative chemosensory protein 13 n=1 Tax=Lygus lineolaris TaxID=50650 RepID=A0A2D0W296_LYGLI|nr:putative chemosensory protein 13 [Lygus lineolaris]
MKILLVTSVLIAVVASQGGLPFLTTSEVNKLISDANYVKNQINCVLGKAKCDNLGNQLKLAIPEVLGRNCRNCDAQQAANARKVTDFMRTNFPAEFGQILKRYRIRQSHSYGR